MAFLVIRVECGVHVLVPWFMVSIEPYEHNQTLMEYQARLTSGKIDSDICLSENFYDVPISFQAANSELGPWIMVSSMCKISSVLQIKKTYIRILLRAAAQAPKLLLEKNAFEVMSQKSKERILPSLQDVTIKNNRKELWNVIIYWLDEKKVGWRRDEVKSFGNLFVATMTAIFWYISGSEAKFTA